MNPNLDDLRRHYSALSDEALLEFNPEDLTEIAGMCYEAELFSRGLKRSVRPKPKSQEPGSEESRPVSAEPQFSMESVPWANTAVPVSEFDDVEEAEQARNVLEQAAIPCELVTNQDAIGKTRRSRARWMSLMVPRSFLQAAQQRLQTQIEQPAAEEDYARHFVEFSDEELLDADIQALPEAARKWYLAELEKRGLQRAGLAAAINLPHGNPASDGFTAVATLAETEAAAAKRFLDTASIPCRVERDSAQGGLETFNILVPSAVFDDAAGVLSQHEKDILGQDPAEAKESF